MVGAVEAGGEETGGAGVVVLAAAANSRPPGLYLPPPPLLAPGFCGGVGVRRLIRIGIIHKGAAVVYVLDVGCSEREERMLVSGTRDRCSGCRLLTQELLSLQKQRLVDRSEWIETAEQYFGEEIIGAHMSPEISGFPGVHHLLDFDYSLQRRRVGFSFRNMKSHGVKQVIIKCHKRSFMKSVMHDTGDSTEALLFPGVGNFFTSGRYIHVRCL